MFFWICLILLGLLAGFFFVALEGYSTMGLVCLGIMGILCFYHFVQMKLLVRIFTLLLCLGLVVFAATEFLIFRASLGSPGADADYLVVLGAKVRQNGPSLSLRNRIDAAYDYLTAHPDAVAVLSGGQGADEPMSEAQCMAQVLTSMGIDPDRLWLEDQSTSTWENFNFSLALIQEKTGTSPEQIAVVTSEYHLFRAGLFAQRLGLEALGVPAPTTLPVLKVNYFIREAVAVWYHLL